MSPKALGLVDEGEWSSWEAMPEAAPVVVTIWEGAIEARAVQRIDRRPTLDGEVLPNMPDENLPAKPAKTAAQRDLATLQNRRRVRCRRRGEMRRFVLANKTGFLWTLTYDPGRYGGPMTDRKQALRDWKVFLQNLVRYLGRSLCWLRVIEHHKSGGLHIHFLTNEFIPWPTVKAAWGRRGAIGAPRVKFARFYRSAAAQRGGLERVASYVAKELLGAAMYSAKEAGEVGPGAHGYEVAQGYGVESIEFGAATLDEACRIIQREFRRLLGVPRMKRRPRQFWSGENRDWCGPPMVWASGLLAA